MSFQPFFCGVLFFVLSIAAPSVVLSQKTSDTEGRMQADTTEARMLLEEILGLVKQRRWSAALNKAESAMQLYNNALGRQTKEVADVLHQIGVIRYSTGNYSLAKEAWSETLEIRLGVFSEDHIDIAKSYNNLGILNYYTGEYKLAIEYGEKALAIRQKLLPSDHSDIGASYNNLGAAYQGIGAYQIAIKYFRMALQIQIKNSGDKNPLIATYYNNLGAMCQIIGDHERAIEYYDRALGLTGSDNLASADIYSNQGISCQSIGAFENSVTYLKKALNIRHKLLGEQHPDVAQCYVNLGNSYYYSVKIDSAISYFENALSRYSSLASGHFSGQAASCNGLGLAYNAIGEYDIASQYHRQALNLYAKSRVEKTDIEFAITYYNLGKNYQCQQLHPQAIEALDSALYILQYSGLRALGKARTTPELIACLSKMASVFRDWHANQTNSPDKFLRESSAYLHQALAALNHLSRSLSPASKSNLAALSAEICSGAIATNQLLHTLTDSIHYLHESFDYAERSKAYLLYEAMQEANALHIAGIPDSLLEQEYNLRIQMAFQDKKKQEKLSSGISETDSTVLAIGSKLFDLKRSHEALIQRFETEFPQYYQAKYGLHTTSVQDLQQSLSPQQTLLQYVVGDSSVFIFLVQQDNFEVQEITKDFPLEKWVDTLTRFGIYGYHTLPLPQRTAQVETATVNNYTQKAQQLYEKLIAPVKSKLTPELIIIPDGVLGYVPFEALLTKAPSRKGNFASYSFLLNEHQISYCYSATMLREMREKQHRSKPSKSVLALAPFFRGDIKTLHARIDTTEIIVLRDSLGPLLASGDEAALISKLWKGTPIYGTAASLDTFQKMAGQYQVLHLSTHGKADDRVGDYAYLAFGAASSQQDYDRLYARDLYNLELNADLVVLSACETGIGKLRRGEGIVSLARAFAYAGAKSIVTSLWKVDDAKTKDLLVDFYRHLKSGETKDAALQQAKLDFLTKNRKGGGAMLHPFFWSGFIAIGDMRAMR